MSEPRVFHRQVVWLAIVAFVGVLFWRLPRVANRDLVVYETYNALVEVDALVRREFVQPVEDDRLVEGAIHGLLRRLDPYSSYLPATASDRLARQTTGEYVGIGVEIAPGARGWTVIAPIRGGPAEQAGVRADDALSAVDGVETERLSLQSLEDLLSGKPGSAVRLTVQGVDDPEPREVVVTRSRIHVASVQDADEALSGADLQAVRAGVGIEYLRLVHFHSGTGRELDAALQRFSDQATRGLILDLRANPGGLMEQALEVLDRFVASGLLLSTVNRRGVVERFEASGGARWAELPLMVLIDRHSASASEIVAGALQSRGRAKVVGERSFGKGSVQHVIPLREGQGAVKLTVAYYRLPSGRILHRTRANEKSDTWGVIPDEPVGAAGRSGARSDGADPVLVRAIEMLSVTDGPSMSRAGAGGGQGR
ncbi:MAG: putative CtpA-like serine protease [Phycisphaerae bacterium]|nr:putative CtpA-like serine protease [Phycisphaerae bacterium]